MGKHWSVHAEANVKPAGGPVMDGVLVGYDTMCRVIHAAYEVDKALAFEAFARQAKNMVSRASGS